MREVMEVEITGKRKKSQPRKSWEECIKKDLERYGLKIEDACDRKKWREQIRAKIANPEKNMTIKVFYAVELFLVIYILKVNNKFYLVVKWPMLVNVFWKNFKNFLIIWWPLTNFCSCKIFLNPVSSNPTKQQLPNCLSAFDHFMGLAHKGLITDSKRSDNFSPKVELSVRSKIIEVHKKFYILWAYPFLIVPHSYDKEFLFRAGVHLGFSFVTYRFWLKYFEVWDSGVGTM